MCQLIEVTWFIWKLSADQLIVLLDRDQCSISYFLASLGSEHRKTDTHIGHQCCDQLTAVKTGYPLTSITWPYRGLRCWPIEVKYFFEVIRWQVTSFQMIAGSSLIFFYEIHMKYVLFLCNTIKILISNWPRTRKFSLLLHALRPFFMFWLVKIWQVSSCGKFMQYLESCLLWQLRLTKFCVNLWCF